MKRLALTSFVLYLLSVPLGANEQESALPTVTKAVEDILTILREDATGVEGEWSAPSVISISKSNTAPVAVISQLTPNLVAVGQVVSLEATATDSTDATVQLKVNWGDGTISAYSNFQACGSVFQFSHTFASPGVFSVKVVARDAQNLEGSWSAPLILTVVKPNSAPRMIW